jgi:hypothetical protein
MHESPNTCMDNCSPQSSVASSCVDHLRHHTWITSAHNNQWPHHVWITQDITHGSPWRTIISGLITCGSFKTSHMDHLGAQSPVASSCMKFNIIHGTPRCTYHKWPHHACNTTAYMAAGTVHMPRFPAVQRHVHNKQLAHTPRLSHRI